MLLLLFLIEGVAADIVIGMVGVDDGAVVVDDHVDAAFADVVSLRRH